MSKHKMQIDHNVQKTHDLSLIIFYLENKGYNVNPISHIGEGIYEVDFEKYAPLASRGYRGQFKVENDQVIELKKQLYMMG